eukprot:8659279-Pyramimonas_sp.AAC.1
MIHGAHLRLFLRGREQLPSGSDVCSSPPRYCDSRPACQSVLPALIRASVERLGWGDLLGCQQCVHLW